MAVETTDGGTMFTDEHISLFVLHALVGRLALGMRGALATAQRLSGSQGRVRKVVMEDYVIWLYEQGVTLGQQWGTVRRCLDNDKRTDALRRKCEKIAAKKEA